MARPGRSRPSGDRPGRRRPAADGRGPGPGRGHRPPAHGPGPFQPRAVPESALDRLQAEAGAFDTWVKPITRSEEEVATVFLISRAEEMEQGDPAYLAELQRWLRTDPGGGRRRPRRGGAQRRSARPTVELAHPRLRRRRPRPAPLPGRGDPDAPPPDVERPRSSSWAPRTTTARPGCRPAGRSGGCCCARRRRAGGVPAHPGARLAGYPQPDAVAAVPRRASRRCCSAWAIRPSRRRRGERPPTGGRGPALRARPG